MTYFCIKTSVVRCWGGEECGNRWARIVIFLQNKRSWNNTARK